MVPVLTLLTLLTAQASDPAAARRTLLQQRFSTRDATPSCEEMGTASTESVTDLLWLMEHVKQPPWVGMRAAECVLLHHAEAQLETIDTWVTDPERRGLALLTLRLLDRLPEAVAVKIASTALAGPMAKDAERRIADSTHAPVRALLAPAEEAPVSEPVQDTTIPPAP